MEHTNPAIDTLAKKNQQQAWEAATFRRLLEHLDARKDVQNLALMELAGFCRNCLAKWYQESAAADGVDISQDGARHRVYGMPQQEWKTKYQQ